MSQKSQIRRALKAGKKITPLSALRDFQCMRLAARIADLRAEGLDIVTSTRKGKGGKEFACYYLAGVETHGPGRPKSETA